MLPLELNLQGNPGGSLFWFVLVVMTIMNFSMAVFWILVGWRAMKAHERLQEVLASISTPDVRSTQSPPIVPGSAPFA